MIYLLSKFPLIILLWLCCLLVEIFNSSTLRIVINFLIKLSKSNIRNDLAQEYSIKTIEFRFESGWICGIYYLDLIHLFASLEITTTALECFL